VLALLIGVPAIGAGSQSGDNDPTVVRVEEDWELVLNEPDGDVGAPQFHTAISPFSGVGWLYAQVTWNYWELPDFQAGGLQLQAWSGDRSLYETSFGSTQLSTSSETVTWTQVMRTTGEQITFEVANGQSQTWGSFGGNQLTMTGHVSILDLNSYDPATSVSNSGVTYGANRVKSLAIVKVRYYGVGGLITVDTTRRPVALPQ
jgi:hypothetical protein